jgi:hypothetical protein
MADTNDPDRRQVMVGAAVVAASSLIGAEAKAAPDPVEWTFPSGKKMFRVNTAHGWKPCTSGDGHYVDQSNCVWVTETEEVVAWNSNPPFTGRLDNNNPVPGHIDGLNVFIKEKSQQVEFLPGKSINDYHNGEDPYVKTCKLVNEPFPQGVFTADQWKKTAILIMDIWNNHPDQGTASRDEELGIPVNAFVSAARNLGALIIHSPSTGAPMNWNIGSISNPIQGRYDATPSSNPVYRARGEQATADEKRARQNAIDARFPPGAPKGLWARTGYYYLGKVGGDSGIPIVDIVERYNDEDFDYIVDHAGNVDSPAGLARGIKGGTPTQQNPKIIIHANDAISADGIDGHDNGNAYEEVLALTKDRPYIIFVGGQTNWCILRRTNGMRKMYKAGKSLALVRDLTDGYCGNGVDGLTKYAAAIEGVIIPDGRRISTMDYTQFTATELVVDWIGRNLGARVTTSDSYFPKGEFQRFWFQDDPRRLGPMQVPR